MVVQTRSEATGLHVHETFRAAYEAAVRDPTIWKISFPIETGERVRLVRVLVPEGQPPMFFYSDILADIAEARR